MSEQEILVQKHVITFCKSLSGHVGKWESLIQDATKPLSILTNLSEQKREIDSAKFKSYDNFEHAQKVLQFQIGNRIEEELIKLKDIVDKLSKSANDLKNKLLTLERSTLSLNWDQQDSPLINGTYKQPSLLHLLQNGLEFAQYFSTRAKLISDSYKSLNFTNAKTLQQLKDAFKVNLRKCEIIVNFLAVTHYIDNEKAIT